MLRRREWASNVATGWIVPVSTCQAPTPIKRQGRDDEEIRRHGEDPSGLPDAAEIADHQHDDEPERHFDPVRLCHAGNAEVIAATPAAMLTATVST